MKKRKNLVPLSGTHGNSPPFQRRESVGTTTRVPFRGRLNFLARKHVAYFPAASASLKNAATDSVRARGRATIEVARAWLLTRRCPLTRMICSERLEPFNAYSGKIEYPNPDSTRPLIASVSDASMITRHFNPRLSKKRSITVRMLLCLG